MTKLKDLVKASVFAVLALFIVLSSPLEVRAAKADGNTTTGNTTQITNILCAAIGQITGPVGRTISVLVVISLALGLFVGKVTWGLAIATAVGMGILFGANDVVSILSGGQSPCTVSTPSQ